MAQFIKVRQKNDIELLINTNIIETVFPDASIANCRSLINFSKPAAKKSFNVQETVEEIWQMILK